MSIDLPLLHINRGLVVGDDIWELFAVDVSILLRAAAALRLGRRVFGLGLASSITTRRAAACLG